MQPKAKRQKVIETKGLDALGDGLNRLYKPLLSLPFRKVDQFNKIESVWKRWLDGYHDDGGIDTSTAMNMIDAILKGETK